MQFAEAKDAIYLLTSGFSKRADAAGTSKRVSIQQHSQAKIKASERLSSDLPYTVYNVIDS